MTFNGLEMSAVTKLALVMAAAHFIKIVVTGWAFQYKKVIE